MNNPFEMIDNSRPNMPICSKKNNTINQFSNRDMEKHNKFITVIVDHYKALLAHLGIASDDEANRYQKYWLIQQIDDYRKMINDREGLTISVEMVWRQLGYRSERVYNTRLATLRHTYYNDPSLVKCRKSKKVQIRTSVEKKVNLDKNQLKMSDYVFEQGESACYAGRCKKQNPFKPESVLHDSWRCGWEVANGIMSRYGGGREHTTIETSQ